MAAPAPPGVRVYIHTLGCPKNDADSRGLARSLALAGIQVVDEPGAAHHVIVNTCGFIQDAKEESIAAVLDACAEHGGDRVVVMGCLVERYGRELEAGIPEVGSWFGLGEEDRLVDTLQAFHLDPASEGGATQERSAHTLSGTEAQGRLSYAYVKISDGCDEPCTFCAIPSIKGPYYSVDPAAILQEVDACLGEGAREIVLVGQDTTMWRHGDLDLVGLIDLLVADERLRRLRLMYLQPEHLGDNLLSHMAQQPKLCRYLDIPLQHADPVVLKRMGRWGEGRTYIELVRRARRLIPGVSLRSTFIVGFPGETDDRFQTLLDFVDEVGFDHAGGFVYSPEEGTRGASLRPRVRGPLATKRLNSLTELISRRAEGEHQSLVGSRLEVMIDRSDPGEGMDAAVIGRTEGQAPEIDGVTYIEGGLPGGTGPGDLVWVTVTDAVGHDLIGRCDVKGIGAEGRATGRIDAS